MSDDVGQVLKERRLNRLKAILEKAVIANVTGFWQSESRGDEYNCYDTWECEYIQDEPIILLNGPIDGEQDSYPVLRDLNGQLMTGILLLEVPTHYKAVYWIKGVEYNIIDGKTYYYDYTLEKFVLKKE